MSVALYMLGDSRLATRQRAARLLLTTMAQETYVDDWQQSLAEVSGTHYMNAERLKVSCLCCGLWGTSLHCVNIEQLSFPSSNPNIA